MSYYSAGSGSGERKDYSRPLHVDCSVEYELPNAAKPPAGARTEPLLMIHPCYYRRAESQRRSPFINNLPATRQSQYSHSAVRYPKGDPMLGGTSSGDSGVSVSGGGVGLWTDTSPLSALHGPDSGIVDDKGLAALAASCWEACSEPASARLYGSSRCQTNADSSRELRDSTNNQIPRHSWAVTSCTDYLSMSCAEVNNNTHQTHGSSGSHSHGQVTGTTATAAVAGGGKGSSRIHGPQPAVGVAAVAACKACQPQFLQPQQRSQQAWPGVTASQLTSHVTSTRHSRARAVEPGPEHTASSLHRRPAPAWPPQWPAPPPAKRSRLLPPATAAAPGCCKVCTPLPASRVLWNNDSMLRLYQV